MDWPLRGKTLRYLGRNLLIALIKEEIVTNVYKIAETKHLNHVYLYTKAGRLLSNFSEYSVAQSLNTRLCPGDDICRPSGLMTVFIPE